MTQWIRFSIPTFLMASVLGLGLGASASAGSCNNKVVRIPPNSDLGKALSSTFLSRANVRGRPLVARANLASTVLVRNCVYSGGNRQEVSLRFLATGEGMGIAARKPYSCGSTFLRTQYSPRRWGEWRNIKTGCLSSRTSSPSVLEDPLPTGDYIPGGNGSPSPDEVYDPDYRDRGSNGGPDEIDDGSGSRGGDEFGDLF